MLSFRARCAPLQPPPVHVMRRPHPFALPPICLAHDTTIPTPPAPDIRTWTVAQKARVLVEAAERKGLGLTAYLKRAGVTRDDYERWAQALKEDPRPSAATLARLDRLKRTLARQQRRMEQAAALLVPARRRLRRARVASPQAEEALPSTALANKHESGRNTRGRARKFDPAMPAHIDQSQLPKGIYWNRTGRGSWYVFVTDPDTGTRNTKVVAGPKARLSVLRAIVGAHPRDYVRGTVGWVMARLEESTDFAALAASTRNNYRYLASILRRFHTQNGRGPSLDTLYVDRLRLPVIQRVIETIAKGRRESVPGAADGLAATPAKANYLLRYLHRLFAWGRRHGHCQSNPAAGAKRVAVRARHGMPTRVAYDAILKFAQVRGAQPPHSAGSLAPYLWPLMEIKYLCRMRTIEVLGLTDAHASEQGMYIARHKRSNDNIVRWSPRLREAWEAAVAVRATIRARLSNKARPIPPPERRFIFVTETATRLSTSALSTAWNQLMRAAVENGVITAEQRFTLHGLKHRGVTDTKGSRRRKQLASGHRTDAMVRLYDHDVPVVAPPARSVRAAKAVAGVSSPRARSTSNGYRRVSLRERRASPSTRISIAAISERHLLHPLGEIAQPLDPACFFKIQSAVSPARSVRRAARSVARSSPRQRTGAWRRAR